LERFWNGTRTTSSERAPATFANGPFSLDPFQSALPSLRITKRRLKRVEAIQRVRDIDVGFLAFLFFVAFICA